MTFRKAIFWTHLVVGLTAGLVILSMCATGMLLAFEPQIVAFAERGIRSVPFPDPASRRLTVEDLLARTLDAFPETPPTALTLESNATASAMIRLGREGSVYVDPYTGAFLGRESKVHRALHTIEEWHRWLGNKPIGKPITGATALCLLGLSLSGVYLWWPRNGVSFKGAAFYKRGLPTKARDWNWHTVTGFWCSLYLIMITSTGAIMSYGLFQTPRPPGANRSREARVPQKPSFEGLNRLVARAEQQVPEWETIFLSLNQKPDEPITFYIQDPSIGKAHARSTLSLDRRSGDVVKWEPFSGLPQGRQARAWVTPMHTGRAWGFAGQLINFVVAFGGLMLVWTGFAMAWRNRDKMWMRFKRREKEVKP